MAINGSSVLLLAQTSAGPPGVYTAIGSQTGVTFDRKATMIDITDKSTAEQQFMAGLRQETISLANLYVPNDTAFQALRTAWKTNTSIIVERQESGTVLEYASALISQLTEDFKMAAAGTVAVTLQVSGGWTPGTAP